MTSNPTSGPPGTMEQYWHWGLPSLVLATMTVLLFVAHAIQAPGVRSRYEAIVRQAESKSIDPSSDADLRVLRTAEIAALRLVILSPDAFHPRWDAATLTLRLAEAFGSRSQVAAANGDSLAARQFYQQANDAFDRGRLLMKRAASISDPDSRQALLWVLRQEAFQSLGSYSANGSHWDRWIQLWRERWQPKETDGPAAELYGSLLLSRALDVGSPMALQDRRNEVQQAIEILDGLTSRSLEGDVWLSEALCVDDPNKGIEHLRPLRSKLISASVAGSETKHVEWADAVFRALMLSVSIDEAGDFAINQLADKSIPNPELLRHTFLRSVLRRIVAIAIAAGRSSDRAQVLAEDMDNLLRIGLRIAPDLQPMIQLVGQLQSKNLDSEMAREISDAWASTAASPLRDAMQWFHDAMQRNEEPPEISDDAPMLQNPLVIVNLMPTFVSVAKKNQVAWDRIDRALAVLVARLPQYPDLRLYRVVLAMEYGKYPMAVSMLEELQQQFPENEQIRMLLISAKKKADTSPP